MDLARLLLSSASRSVPAQQRIPVERVMGAREQVTLHNLQHLFTNEMIEALLILLPPVSQGLFLHSKEAEHVSLRSRLVAHDSNNSAA